VGAKDFNFSLGIGTATFTSGDSFISTEAARCRTLEILQPIISIVRTAGAQSIYQVFQPLHLF
jgi:hypothetical protein